MSQPTALAVAQIAATMAEEDWNDLRSAHARLEHPSFAARLTSKLGKPIERVFQLLPETWSRGVQEATRSSLEKTLSAAILTLGKVNRRPRSDRYHKSLAVVSGAVGGLFGLPAVVAELPVTSAIILRSIADIARGHGENLSDPNTRLACIEVFALGGRSQEDDATEAGYYGLRLVLGMHFSRISDRVATQGIVRWSPPALVRLIAEIAARFGVVVTQKAALQMVPMLGAGTASLVNVIFVEHFQDIARAHFTIRRLERRYGPALVKAGYRQLGERSGKEQPPLR
jgi:hypothetical protein